jgi:hypothetical protein
MTLTRIPPTGRVRPSALLKLALRRMAGVAILVISLAVLHELALSNALPTPPTAATPVAEHCTS